MAKKVEMLIEIDEEGKIHARPQGTQGSECIDLMKFLDDIKGATVEETQKLPEADHKKVQIAGHQYGEISN